MRRSHVHPGSAIFARLRQPTFLHMRTLDAVPKPPVTSSLGACYCSWIWRGQARGGGRSGATSRPSHDAASSIRDARTSVSINPIDASFTTAAVIPAQFGIAWQSGVSQVWQSVVSPPVIPPTAIAVCSQVTARRPLSCPARAGPAREARFATRRTEASTRSIALFDQGNRRSRRLPNMCICKSRTVGRRPPAQAEPQAPPVLRRHGQPIRFSQTAQARHVRRDGLGLLGREKISASSMSSCRASGPPGCRDVGGHAGSWGHRQGSAEPDRPRSSDRRDSLASSAQRPDPERATQMSPPTRAT